MATSSWCQDTLCWPRRWIWKKRVAGQMADPGLSIYHLILPGKTWEICPGSNFQERYWGKLFQSGQFSWSRTQYFTWKSFLEILENLPMVKYWGKPFPANLQLGEFSDQWHNMFQTHFLWIRILDCAGIQVVVWNYPGSIPAPWAKRNCPASGRRQPD